MRRVRVLAVTALFSALSLAATTSAAAQDSSGTSQAACVRPAANGPCVFEFVIAPGEVEFTATVDLSRLSAADRDRLSISVSDPLGQTTSVDLSEPPPAGVLLKGFPMAANVNRAQSKVMLRAHLAAASTARWQGTWFLSFSGPNSQHVTTDITAVSHISDLSVKFRHPDLTLYPASGSLNHPVMVKVHAADQVYGPIVTPGSDAITCGDTQWIAPSSFSRQYEGFHLKGLDHAVLDEVGADKLRQVDGNVTYEIAAMQCVELGSLVMPWAIPDSVTKDQVTIPALLYSPDPSSLLTRPSHIEIELVEKRVKTMTVHVGINRDSIGDYGTTITAASAELQTDVAAHDMLIESDEWSCTVPSNTAAPPRTEYLCDPILVTFYGERRNRPPSGTLNVEFELSLASYEAMQFGIEKDSVRQKHVVSQQYEELGALKYLETHYGSIIWIMLLGGPLLVVFVVISMIRLERARHWIDQGRKAFNNPGAATDTPKTIFAKRFYDEGYREAKHKRTA